MNDVCEVIFNNTKLNIDKLSAFGFDKADGGYIYRLPICGGQMSVAVHVTEKGKVTARVFDADTGDEYTLHTVDGASGEFVGRVRSELEDALKDIAQSCFDGQIFKGRQAEEITAFCADKFATDPEFLWEDTPDTCVFRRSDNNKWFAAIISVVRKKLGISGISEGLANERIEVLDVRALPETIDGVVDNVRFFRGYHMNKKHWLTVPLDGTLPVEEIFPLIETSYHLAKKK